MQVTTAFFISILSLAIAVALSILLWLRPEKFPGCGPKSSCDAVTSSRWSRFGNVHVSTLGMLFYLLMLLAEAGMILAADGRLAAALGFALVAGATIAIGAAAWFMALQVFAIRKICPVCSLTHAAGALAGGSTLLWFGSVDFIAMIVGAACLALFAILQMCVAPRLHEVIAGPEAATEPPSPHLRADSKTIRLFNERVALALADWPLLGASSATQTIALLYDITCPDCRELYRMLSDAAAGSNGQLAILAVPVPMHPDCNPAVLRQGAFDADTCDHVRLALALWRIDRPLYYQYKSWLFGRSTLASVYEARSHASRALGATRLTLALGDSSVESLLRTAVEIYRVLPRDQLPQILLADRIIRGKVTMPELREHLRAKLQ